MSLKFHAATPTFTPEKGDTYFTVQGDTLVVQKRTWNNHKIDNFRLSKRIVFRDYDSANGYRKEVARLRGGQMRLRSALA